MRKILLFGKGLGKRFWMTKSRFPSLEDLKPLKLYWRFRVRELEEWGLEDQEALKCFLTSRSGKKLQEVMRQQAIRQAENATTKVGNLEHACGYALGFRACFATLLTLTATLAPKEEGHETEKDGGRGFEI